MSRLYHPHWTRTNGEVGGHTFKDWTRELLPYGSKGVLAGLQTVKNAGNSYIPPLGRFLSMCREGNQASAARGFGSWETCPYTGRKRRLRLGHESLAKRLGSDEDPRTQEQIGIDIERMIEVNPPPQ